jgi:hypothetical protein
MHLRIYVTRVNRILVLRDFVGSILISVEYASSMFHELRASTFHISSMHEDLMTRSLSNAVFAIVSL